MFELNETYEVQRRILKVDYNQYSPSESSTKIFATSRTYINIPKEDAVIFLLNSYLDLIFD